MPVSYTHLKLLIRKSRKNAHFLPRITTFASDNSERSLAKMCIRDSVVGEAHNEIIKELCELYKGKELDDVSDEQMYQDILKLTLKYYNVSPNAVDKNAWKELQTSAEKICSDVAHKNPEEAIAYLRAYPRGDKRELNIIADYLVKVKSLPTEKLRKEYAKGFSERVKLSSITEQSKQTIMNATATGFNSIALWEQK